MEQKVIQIGNSIGIVIPQLLNRENGLKPGDPVVINKKGSQYVVSPLKAKRKSLAGGVNVRFMKMLDEFIQDHEDVLKELAKR